MEPPGSRGHQQSKCTLGESTPHTVGRISKGLERAHPTGPREKPVSQGGGSGQGGCALLPSGAAAPGARFQQLRP